MNERTALLAAVGLVVLAFLAWSARQGGASSSGRGGPGGGAAPGGEVGRSRVVEIGTPLVGAKPDQLDGADDVVVEGESAVLVLTYPLSRPVEFPVTADQPTGFSKRHLVAEIVGTYVAVYDEEAATSTIPVVPLSERVGLINRNRTNGKYGIWGHDLEDLYLDAIEVSRDATGRTVVDLEISS